MLVSLNTVYPATPSPPSLQRYRTLGRRKSERWHLQSNGTMAIVESVDSSFARSLMRFASGLVALTTAGRWLGHLS